MSIFFQHLRDPEYMHVLLNPIPVYGLAFGAFALVLALFLRNHRVTIAALVLVFVAGISAWPVYQYGESAYDQVKSMSDQPGEQWLDEHMARGEKMIWMFYVLAGVAAAGVGVTLKWPRRSVVVAIMSLAWSSATLAVGGYISYAGGHVRHREFRFEPPPVARAEEHHHGEEEHGHEATEQGTAPTSQKPEHAEHEAMQSPAQQPMEHAGHEQRQSPAEKPLSEEEKKQLEASRLQLEASQKQLEASRKQLEATEAKSSASPGRSPAASPSPSQSPEHKHDEHEHP